MFQISVPGIGDFELNNLVLDMNGTISKDGGLLPGVDTRIQKLKEQFRIFLLTADTFGTALLVADQLGIELQTINPLNGGPDKRDFINRIGSDRTAAIGNGFNDALMMSTAGISIAVIGPEGCSGKTIQSAMIVCNDILDALDLLINPKRLVATLRA